MSVGTGAAREVTHEVSATVKVTTLALGTVHQLREVVCTLSVVQGARGLNPPSSSDVRAPFVAAQRSAYDRTGYCPRCRPYKRSSCTTWRWRCWNKDSVSKHSCKGYSLKPIPVILLLYFKLTILQLRNKLCYAKSVTLYTWPRLTQWFCDTHIFHTLPIGLSIERGF